MKDILTRLIEHESLDKKAAKDALIRLANGEYNSTQMAAFLMVFNMRSITIDELLGFREAMLELCVSLDFKQYDAIDLCGTGGDGKDTFNISTLASFIVAGAGQKVAKHGNNSATSVCGSSNVLDYFGYTFTNDESKLRKSIETLGICYMHAPLFHPAMKNVAPIRKELGVKTFFNMLGPMTNPSAPTKQLVGVFNLDVARKYAYVYQHLDKDFIILHALDGYDEVSLTGDFKAITNDGEQLLSPADLGLGTYTLDDIKAATTIEDTAKIFKDVLEGNGTQAQEEVVIANAGMGLYCGNKKEGVLTAMEKAKESLASGKALQVFKQFISQ